MTRLIIAMAALLCAGCDTTHNPFLERHAAEDWHRRSLSNLDKAITEDCRSYLKTLSPRERKSVLQKGIERDIENIERQRNLEWNQLRVYENGTGKRAVEISIPLQSLLWSVEWDHILIYDANNKRIQTLKYKAGHYVEH